MSGKRAVKIKSGKDKVNLSEENKMMDNKHKGNNEIKNKFLNEKTLNRKYKEGEVKKVKKLGVECESKAANAEKVATN